MRIHNLNDINSGVITILATIMLQIKAQRKKLQRPPERPAKPIKATITEYNEYIKQLNDVISKERKYHKTLERLDYRERQVQYSIALLPVNIWFLNDEKTHAVANHRKDWGGGEFHYYAEISYEGTLYLNELKP